MSMGRATCPLLWAAPLGAAEPCVVSLTTGLIAPASLRYDRLTPMAGIAGPRCLAGNPLLDCVPARLSPVASMAPGDVCYGPRCGLPGHKPAALGYRPCCWPARSAGSPQCAQPMGCGLLLPVPRSPLVRTCLRCPGPLGSCSPVCPLGVFVLRMPCPGPLGSCSPVCPLSALSCVCRVLGHLAPAHWCARSVHCVVCVVSWAAWLLFTGVPARGVVLRVRCPGPLGSCSLVCPLVVLRRVRGVVGHLAPVYRFVGSVFCVVRAVLRATWFLFTSVPARWVVSCVQCPAPLGSCSPVCWLGALCCVCGVLGRLAPVHWCARSVCCVACAVSWATGLLLTGVPARCVVSCLRCPGPLGSRSPVCWLGVLCCVCGVLGHLAPVHL